MKAAPVSNAANCDFMLFPFFPLQVFFGGGAGMPAILMLTEPKWLRLVKNDVFRLSPTEGDVGRCRLATADATELLSRGIENIDSTRTAAIHVSGPSRPSCRQ